MYRRSELLTVVLFCIVVASMTLAYIVMPDKNFSEQENRDLATFPELTKESFFSGEFASKLNEYFADQFPLHRDSHST